MQGRWWVASGVALLVLWACSAPQWKVRDLDGQIVQLQDPHFAPNETITLQVGSISRAVEASQIDWLEMDPSEVHSEGGIVFYGVRVLLRDGTRYPDPQAADTVRGVFLSTEGRLEGRAATGLVSVPIAQIREFGGVLYLHNRDSIQEAQKHPVADSTHKLGADSTKTTPVDTTKTAPKK